MERTVTIQRTYRYTERTCASCGTTFEGWGRARYCSLACKNKADYEAHGEDRRAKRRDRYHRQKGATNAEGSL